MKKILAITLVLIMTLAMSTTAFAGFSNDSGTAAIEFTVGTTFNPATDGVYCPANTAAHPTAVSTAWLTGTSLQSMDVNFGQHALSLLATQTFNSWDPGGGGGAGSGDRVGALVVASATGWHVTVAINGFTRQAPNSGPTMAGFNMDMTPLGTAYAQPSPGGLMVANTLTVATTLEAGAAGAVGAPRAILQGTDPVTGWGIHGRNFNAGLTVPGGTAHAGHAQATMTWTFVAATP